MKAILTLVLSAMVCGAAEPPRMLPRGVAQSKTKVPGEQVQLREGTNDFTLFIPQSWNSNAAAHTLTMHFHTAAWFIIQEHVRRGSPNPLACFHLGEGSTVYRRAFEDPNRLSRVRAIVTEALQKRAATKAHIGAVELSSFSAGYGAIRELVKSTNTFKAVVLADSMYASLGTNAGPRRPADEHINVWLPLARAAMNRESTFVFTYSEVPTQPYASSSECAAALISALGLTNAVVAADDSAFPLLRRVDFGNLHIWGYGGTNAQAHLVHARHLAETWNAIERRP